MTITQIYTHYLIPTNLQDHMLKVGAVGSLICKSVTDIEVDCQVLVKTLLLHDMGNILKFNFDRVEMLSEVDRDRVDELKKIQVEFRKKYGQDADEATLQIMREISCSEQMINLCGHSHGIHSSNFQANEWEKKISFYCDMRVGPFGIISIEERFADLAERYPRQKQMSEFHHNCSAIEKEINQHIAMDIKNIDNQIVNREIKNLKRVEV